MKNKIVLTIALLIPILLSATDTLNDIQIERNTSTNLPKFSGKNYDSNEYIEFLEENSMLFQSKQIAKNISGKGIQWQNEYTEPQPEKVIKKASVWFDAYPSSIMGKEGENTLQILGSEELWKTFDSIGIRAIHTGPMATAGGIEKNYYTKTVDGGFDPIMYRVDPKYGSDNDFKTMSKVASKNNGIIISDVVPGHTGKGPDFWLATRNYEDYPGLYTIVAIDEKDWSILPKIDNIWETKGIDKKTVDVLTSKGYLPGQLENVRFKPAGYENIVTGWDATAPIKCADGKTRRWVYLHYYRAGQPTLNWLDPSFAAQRIITGGIAHDFNSMGVSAVRLDANAFLGIENVANSNISWSNATPLTIEATNYLAMFARKLGGWTYEEVGLPFNMIKEFLKLGPDITIDFITRTGLIHGAMTGDSRYLNLMLREIIKADIDPKRLLHTMQSHDNLGYDTQEVESHPNRLYNYGKEKLSGKEIREKLLKESSNRMPYLNQKGSSIGTTYAGLLASRFKVKDIYSMSYSDKNKIQKGIELVTVYSAMQPGIINISGWDLVGALPLKMNDKTIANEIKQGDYRWLNRGAYDLLGDSKNKTSDTGITKAVALFGSLPEQLKDSNSYASQLQHILSVREKYEIPLGKILDVPEVKNNGSTIMINQLPTNQIQITALNFSDSKVSEKIDLSKYLYGKSFKIKNILTDKYEENSGNKENLVVNIEPLSYKVFVIEQ